MKARDIMTPNPSTVTPGETVAQAAAIMRDLDVGIAPVVDDRFSMKLAGVLTDRDIAVRCVAGRHAPGCLVRDHMSRGPVVVSPDAETSEVIATMKRAEVRRVPVVGRGRPVGIIAQADLAVKLGPKEPLAVEHLLEEISERPHAVTTPL